MKYRKFLGIGWNISEVGLGCWAIGSEWGNVSEFDAIKVLKTAIDNCVIFFDTADVYGDGRSEKFLAELIKSTSEKLFVNLLLRVSFFQLLTDGSPNVFGCSCKK